MTDSKSMTGFMSAAVRTHNSVRNDSNGLPVLQRTGEDNAQLITIYSNNVIRCLGLISD
jgi:hypothetical protein